MLVVQFYAIAVTGFSLKVTKNKWPKLYRWLDNAPKHIPDLGEKWATDSGDFLDKTYREYLATQGRGGEPPPLSAVTHHLYGQLGHPDGSGIRNHIRLISERQGDKFVVTFGILTGDPSMVATVQDQGATIRVTEKMRGFLAAHGVFLRASTTHIHIPGRHSWEYSLRDAKEEAKKLLRQFWADLQKLV